MKLQLQHEAIDPDVPPPDLADGPANTDNADIRDGAYIIGAGPKPAMIVTSDRPAKKPKLWVKPLAYGLCAACVALTVWNVSRLVIGPPRPSAPTPFQLKQALYLGVMKVDMYRRAHGVTPASLNDVDLPANGYTYHRISGDHYVLSFQVADGPMSEYNSAQSKEAVFGTPQSILAMEESR